MTPTFQLVTTDQAIVHLKYVSAEVDASDLAKMIGDASAIVMSYLKLTSYPDAWLDTNGSPSLFTVPPAIQRATLLVLGMIDADKLGEKDPLTPGAISLLQMYRLPTIA